MKPGDGMILFTCFICILTVMLIAALKSLGVT